MKKIFAVVTLAMVLAFAGVGTAFAAPSPAPTPSVTPTISGSATGTSGSLVITPNPAKDGGPQTPVTVTVNPDGTFSVDGLTFTKPGTYYFTVTDPNDPNTVYTLRVDVTENEDGTLSATYTWLDAKGNQIDPVLSYKGSTTPAPKSGTSGTSGTSAAGSKGKVGTAKTADIPMFAIGGVVAVAAIAGGVTILSRRRASQL